MANITAFPAIHKVSGNCTPITLIADATIKAGQVVGPTASDASNKAIPSTGAKQPFGVAIYDAIADIPVAIANIGSMAYVANADDTTAIPAGVPVSASANVVGGTVEEGSKNVVGITIDIIPPSGVGRIIITNSGSHVRTATVTVAAASSPNQEVADFIVPPGADAAITIQAAISSLPDEGGWVHLMAGTYTISSTINLCKQLVLDGDGITNTNIVLADNANCDMLKRDCHAMPGLFVTIAQLSLNGNRTHNTTGHGIHLAGTAEDGETAYDIRLQDIYVKYCAENGVHVTHSWGNKYTNVVSEWCDWGMHITNSRETTITGCHCTSNDDGGIAFVNSSYINLSGGEYGRTDAGVGISCDADTDYISVIGSSITNCSSHAILCLGDLCSFIGCKFDANTGDALNISGAYNTIDGCQITYNHGYGVRLSGHTNTVLGCELIGNFEDGVEVTADYNTVSSCQILANRKNGINVSGDNNTLTANTVNTNRYNGILNTGNYTIISASRFVGNSATNDGLYSHITNSGVAAQIASCYIDAYVNVPKHYIESSGNYAVIRDVYVSTYGSYSHNISGSNLSITNLGDYVTEASGTHTVAAGSTSITLAHGLSATPAAGDIFITPTGDWGAVTSYWISAYAATTFTVTVDQTPGGAGFPFAWTGKVLQG